MSLILLEQIFVYGVIQVHFDSFHVDIKLFQHCLLKRLLPLNDLGILAENQ